ncbi:hypothetical protein B7H23_12790 [Notoacmeibacter marinus]|uniref:JmjC domain-containing protein n=1 Tax=Notoacmeibacter marinus TaxID=1876515 RepID=A0A231UT06_9HYPH|nr:hypothetical protein [Notoacmeibacter marinus]OXS99077.1 hypothetical protein B7H23_12790 [Notoacmeibacter marinus]
MTALFSEFYDATKRFRRPYGESIVTHPYTEAMVKECLDRLANEPDSKISKKCRIYRNGRQLGPFEAKEFIIEVSRFPTLASVAWEELTEGEPFLIFVNFAALLSHELSEASRRFIGDFARRFEPEGISIEHHLIIGKYDETAFGVHIDDATDRVFHFNLGPSAKEMILWPREDYLASYNGDLARPLKSVSTSGSQTHPMPVGGCFFLPADYYHVGRSPHGVSVVVSLALTRQNHKHQMAATLAALDLFANVKESADDYYKDFSSRPDPDAFANVWAKAEEIGFANLLEHARARNRSNNYFIEVSPIDASPLPSEAAWFEIEDASNLQLIDHNGSLNVYSRGHYASLHDPAHIKIFKDAVQTGRFEFSMRHFQDARERGDRGTALLGWLIATKGAARSYAAE